MSEKDEKQEQPDVEGHAHFNEGDGAVEDEKQGHGAHLQEGDDTPDIEGHFHKKSPTRFHKK
jgi:hypothetical protein